MLPKQHSNMENTTPNLYDAIGVNADASSESIKKRTRKLINEVRESDKRNSEKNELIRFFKSLRKTLCDPSERKEYDASIGIETVAKQEGEGHNYDADAVVPFEALNPLQPFGALGALGALGDIGNLGSLLGPMETSPSRSPASSLLSLVGSDMRDMFSNSIVPEELTSSGGLKPGTFQILEYTKVRNPGGGFDEFGFTRQGDIKNERVTEKRFERKS